MNTVKSQKKGFTLVELVIVIGILAILAAVVVVVLNPAQLLAQARDSQRISDLSSMGSAFNLYLATATTTLMSTSTAACTANCYIAVSGVAANCGSRHGTKNAYYISGRTVDSGGWVPIDLRNTTGGSPLSTLPVDPSNTTTYFYSYACDNANYTYEVDANMESTRYANAGDNDKESNTKDGGNNDAIYEMGNDPGLDI